MKSRVINVKGAEVTIAIRHEQDYISLLALMAWASAAPTADAPLIWHCARPLILLIDDDPPV